MGSAGDDATVLLALRSLSAPAAVRIALRMDRATRLALRDSLIRDRRKAEYPTLSKNLAAHAIAADLADPELADDMRQVLELNGGQPLRWRQITSIITGPEGWRGW